MQITRENVKLPDEFWIMLCGHRPDDQERKQRLSAALFDENEWRKAIGTTKKRLRQVLDSHRQPSPFNKVVFAAGMSDTARRRWNSCEEVWQDKGANLGPFHGGRIFSVECQIVLYWDIRFHNGRQSYPIPICFNPNLLIKQWQIYQENAIPSIRQCVSDKRWKKTAVLLPGVPDSDPEIREEYLKIYNIDCSNTESDRMLLVTQYSLSATGRFSKAQFVGWTRADLVSDYSEFLTLRRQEC